MRFLNWFEQLSAPTVWLDNLSLLYAGGGAAESLIKFWPRNNPPSNLWVTRVDINGGTLAAGFRVDSASAFLQGAPAPLALRPRPSACSCACSPHVLALLMCLLSSATRRSTCGAICACTCADSSVTHARGAAVAAYGGSTVRVRQCELLSTVGEPGAAAAVTAMNTGMVALEGTVIAGTAPGSDLLVTEAAVVFADDGALEASVDAAGAGTLSMLANAAPGLFLLPEDAPFPSLIEVRAPLSSLLALCSASSSRGSCHCWRPVS